jgi:two-component sensor histidine kinase
MSDDRAALARCREQHELVVELGSLALSGTGTIDALLQHAAQLAARGTGIARSKVMEYRPESDSLFLRAGVGWREGVVGDTMMSAAISEPQGRSFRAAEPLVIEDLASSDFTVPELLQEHGIVALANVPVFAGGAVWGGLEVDSERPGSLTKADTLLLQGFAHILGRAIDQQQRRLADEAEAIEREVMRKERDVLFRELHHRVANNFTAILGQLELQARKTTVPEARAAFQTLADRVASIADAHEQLSLTEVERDISVGFYLTRLVAGLPHPDNVKVVRAICEAMLPLRTAVRLGMMLNELVTNSLKHAFTAAGGTISVGFSAAPEEGMGRLVVSDNGRGLAPSPPGRSGKYLVEALVNQIGGVLEQTSDPGVATATTITFPLRPPP